MPMPRLAAVCATCVLPALVCAQAARAQPTAPRVFGVTAERDTAHTYALIARDGASATLTDYGARLTELRVRDARGQLGDVVIGFDRLDDYLNAPFFLGATMGRVANRIAGGRFTLDGHDYTLAVNNGPNALHGGRRGFDKRLWRATRLADSSVAFDYTSPDGEEGYPGTLHVTVRYTLGRDATHRDDALRIDYTATSDRATPVNLTNHSYFNLGAPNGVRDVRGHVLTVFAHHYTPVDATQIPTGAVDAVAGTPLDFTRPHAVGERLGAFATTSNGYDHNFVLDSTRGGRLALAARVEEPTSGRVMEVLTTQPGMQLYTSNHVTGPLVAIGGVPLAQYVAMSLETQHFPDAVHHASFPSTILRPGQTFRSTTVYRFIRR